MPACSDSGSDTTRPIDNEGSFSHSSHDITLQRLDTHLPYQGVPSGRLKYSVDNFAGTESAWDRTLAVFVPKGVPVQHVDHSAFARDPHGEARRMGYRIVGSHTNTQVIANGPGEPRAVTKAVFTDPEVDRLATEGKLSLSTGFDAKVLPDGIMEGKVSPNHVLYFLRNERTAAGTPASPNDAGAFVNNLSEETMADDEIKGLTQSVKELIGIHKENPLQKTVDNLNGEMDAKDKEIAALKAEIEDLKAKLGKVDNILAEQEKTRKDTQWAQVKNLYQPVMFHKPEDEAAHRLSFEKDPVAFQLANVGNLAPTGTKPKAEGKEAVGNVGGADQPFDIVAARGKLNPTTGRYE